MSRAHMLYDNKALSTLPVKTTVWKGGLNENVLFKKKSGVGLIIEGKIHGRSRHCIIDGVNSSNRFRYVALHVEILKAIRRKYDSMGKEIEPDLGSKKKINTGYLSSSYKSISKEGEDIISPGQSKELLKISQLDDLNEKKVTSTLNVALIWCNEKDLEGVEISDGSMVRLRTIGEGPYLESIVCLDEERTSKINYSTGESVGGSWTEKVLNVKDEKASGAHLTDDSKAIDEDEWND